MIACDDSLLRIHDIAMGDDESAATRARILKHLLPGIEHAIASESARGTDKELVAQSMIEVLITLGVVTMYKELPKNLHSIGLESLQGMVVSYWKSCESVPDHE